MRRALGLRGHVEAEAVAQNLGFSIERRQLVVLEEMRVTTINREPSTVRRKDRLGAAPAHEL